MAAIDDLKAARDNMAARLKEITASPKPSYDMDGQRVSWTQYQTFLLDGIERLDKQIANDEGPYELDTFVVT